MRLCLFAATASAFLLSGCISPAGRPTVYSTAAIRAHCRVDAEIALFMKIRKPRLKPIDRYSGFITTPLKYLSTKFDGPHAWEKTGCSAVGSGYPVREAQHSTDGLYTIDVSINELRVEGVAVPSGRYVRLEVFPGTPAHRSLEIRRPKPSDLIVFEGPLVWDKDTDACHAHGHMEVHPFETIKFVVSPR
jgi:hypothetical protein